MVSEFKRLTHELQLDYLVKVLIQQEIDEKAMLKILEISDAPTRRRIKKKINTNYSTKQALFLQEPPKPRVLWYKIKYEDILAGKNVLPILTQTEIDALDEDRQIQYYFYQGLQKLQLFEKQKFAVKRIQEINLLSYQRPVIIKSKKRYQQYIGNTDYSIYKLLKHENETQWYDIDFGMLIFKGYLALDYLSKQEILKLDLLDRERYYLLETLQEYMDDPLLSTLYTQPFVNIEQIKQHIQQYEMQLYDKEGISQKKSSITALRNKIQFLKNNKNKHIYTDNIKRLRMINSEFIFENYATTGVIRRVKFESDDPGVKSQYMDVLAKIRTVSDDRKEIVEEEKDDDELTRVLKKIELDFLELECYREHGIISSEKQMVMMILKKLSPELRMKLIDKGAENWDPPTLIGEIETHSLSSENKKQVMTMLKCFYKVVKKVEVLQDEKHTIYLCKKEKPEQQDDITWLFGTRRSNIDFYKREHFWFMGDRSLTTRFMFDEYGRMRTIYKESILLKIKDNDTRRVCRRLLGLKDTRPSHIDSNYIHKMKQKLMRISYKNPFKRLSRMHIIYTLQQLPLDMELRRMDEILHCIDNQMRVKLYKFEKRSFIHGPPSTDNILEVQEYEERQEAMYLIIHRAEIEAKLKEYFSKSKKLTKNLTRAMQIADKVKFKVSKPQISNTNNTFEYIEIDDMPYIPFQNKNSSFNFYISALRSVSYFDLITFTRDLICSMDNVFAESNIFAIHKMLKLGNQEMDKSFYYVLLKLFYQVLNEKKIQAYVITSLQREIKCNLKEYMDVSDSGSYGDMSPKLWNCDTTEVTDDGFYIDNVKIFDIEDILRWQMKDIMDTLSFVDNKISKPDHQAVLGVDKTNVINLNAVLRGHGWNTLLDELQENTRLTLKDQRILYSHPGSQSRYMLVKPKSNVKLMRGIYRAPFSTIVHSRKCQMFRLVLYKGIRRICCPHKKKLFKCCKCRPIQCKFPCAYSGKAVIEVVLNHYIRGHGIVICYHFRNLRKCPHCKIGTKVVVFW